MSSLPLYPYQHDCVDHAMKQNTIVVLPTGKGKTLIAAKVIEHFLTKFPEKNVAFMVPTRPLVDQQATYCREHCHLKNGSPPLVQRLVGQEQTDWTQAKWDECTAWSDIMLGTPAVFQRAFVSEKYIKLSDFSLLVFDECHNATGNSPMAAVLRDGVAPMREQGLETPRILGLTASFVNGSLTNIESKRCDLEALMQSTLFCPEVTSHLTDESFKLVIWKTNRDIESHREEIDQHIKEASKKLGKIKELGKVINRCTHVFEELGLESLLFFIEKVVLEQILAKAATLFEIDDVNCRNLAAKIHESIPKVRDELTILSTRIKDSSSDLKSVAQSFKLQELIKLLKDLFEQRSNSLCGIVFVQQVALASPLAKHLNDSLGDKIRCAAVAGVGYQPERERQEQLDKFHLGKTKVLVATATLEEGIDVSRCEFVVRFSSVPTTKAHIQGSGRARHANAIIYYFDNNPAAERKKEATMNQVARTTSLSLDTEEFKTRNTQMVTPVPGKHPFPSNPTSTDKGQVNVFNCKRILNEYCSIMLGTSVTPSTNLYTYQNEPGSKKVLSSIRFPTPDGWHSVNSTENHNFWKDVDLKLVLTEERTKRKSASDKEEMCFVYLVVKTLREFGYLDHHNNPDRNLRERTRRNCPLENTESEDGVHIKNTIFQSSP